MVIKFKFNCCCYVFRDLVCYSCNGSSFNHYVALLFFRYIAKITKQKAFNKSQIDAYAKLLEPDDWKVRLHEFIFMFQR